MAVKGFRITITDEPTKINVRSTDQFPGLSLALDNMGVQGIDLGGPDVGTGEAFALASHDRIGVDLQPGEDLYGVCASGQSTELGVLQTGA